jgi:hypothetical protein
MTEVTTLVPTCLVLQLPVKTQMVAAKIEADILVGPFETEAAAVDWIAAVSDYLRREQESFTAWCIENGVAVKKVVRYDAVQINGRAKVMTCHRSQLKLANVPDSGPDGFKVYEPGDPQLFADDLQRIILHRVAEYAF